MNKLITSLSILMAFVMACDGDTLQNKTLMTDNRSGKRAADLKSDDVQVETASASSGEVEEDAGPGSFTFKVQGALPDTESGQGSYELYITAPRADTYQFVVLKDAEACSFEESAAAAPASEPIKFETTEEGAYRLCVKAFDPEGIQSDIFLHTWLVDLKKPDLALYNVPATMSGQTNLRLTVSSTKAGAYKFAFTDATKPCTEATFSDEVALSNPIVLDLATDGLKRICVKAIDAFGIESNLIEQDWMFSAALPSLSLQGLPTPYTVNNEVTIAIEAGTGFDTYQYNILQGSSDCSKTAYGTPQPALNPITSNLGVPGLNTLCIKATNLDGVEIGPISHSWNFDLIRKSLVLSELPEFEDPKEQLAITISGLNIAEYKYALIREDNVSCGNMKYSAFRPIDQAIEDKLSIGGYTLCTVVKNNNGQVASPDNFAWSRIKMPEVTVNPVSGMPPAITNQTLFEGIIAGGINVETYKFGVAPGDVECATVTLGDAFPVITPFTIDIGAPTVDGTYTVCLQGIGHFAQLSAMNKSTFAYDTTPPAFAFIDPPDDPSTITTVAITVDSVSATEYTYVKKLGNVGCDPAPESNGRFPIASILSESFGQGQQTLCVWVFDSVGNPSAPRALSWKIDSISPDILSVTPEPRDATSINLRVTLNNVEADGAVFRYTQQDAIPGDLLACDSVPDPVVYDKARNITNTQRINLGAVGEETRICLYAEDTAGNVSPIEFVDIPLP